MSAKTVLLGRLRELIEEIEGEADDDVSAFVLCLSTVDGPCDLPDDEEGQSCGYAHARTTGRSTYASSFAYGKSKTLRKAISGFTRARKMANV